MAENVQQNDFNSTLQRVVQTSLNNSLLAKGLHEVCKAIESKQAKFVILADNCEEQQYVKLVKALAKANEIRILAIPKGETLGEWIGICKLDSQKTVRKHKKCSSVVVKEFAPEITDDEKKVITDKL